MVGLARSSFYHAPSCREDGALREALNTQAAIYPTYGYRRLTALLAREGWTVNRKRVQRLMREMGLQRPVKRRKTRTTNSEHAFARYANLVKDEKAAHPRVGRNWRDNRAKTQSC